MKKTFPLEDVLTFVDGHFISFKKVSPIDESCFLYQIANLVTGEVHDPFMLMMEADRIKLMVKSQFPEITDWDIGEPEGGWNSTHEPTVGNAVATANKKVFVDFLYIKFNRTSFDLEGPDPINLS